MTFTLLEYWRLLTTVHFDKDDHHLILLMWFRINVDLEHVEDI